MTLTLEHRRRLSRGGFAVSVAVWIVAAAISIAQGQYGFAAWDITGAALMLAVSWGFEHLHQHFDATLRKARAEGDMSEMARAEVARQIEAGQMLVNAHVRRDWMN